MKSNVYKKIDFAKAENAVVQVLRRQGIHSNRIHSKTNAPNPFDVLTEAGQKIEVKASSYKYLDKRRSKGKRGWKFVIARQGILNERDVDWYVLYCAPTPNKMFGRTGFYIVVKAPLKVGTVEVSARNLFENHKLHRRVNSFDGIVRAEHRLQKLVAA